MSNSVTSPAGNPASRPLVSICIPTFNGERFIEAAIKSALAQTYRPIEILISDDDSSDRTLEIAHSLLDQYVGEYSLSDRDLNYSDLNPIQAQILAHSRYGLANNWNFCIHSSQGTQIKFLFQDDLLLPNCLAEMVQLAQQDDQIGLVFCQREVICEDGLEFDPVYGTDLTHQWHRLQTIQSGLDLLLDQNLLSHPLNKIGEPSNVLISRWAIAQTGDFDTDLVQVLDWDMWLRMFAVGKVGYLDQVLVKFRVHSAQVSQANAISGASWLDNWRLQLKMLSDRQYEFLPEGLREQVLTECISQLRILHQSQQQLNDQIDKLHLDLQAIANQLTRSQTDYQATIDQLLVQNDELEESLANNYHQNQNNVDQLTAKIDQLAAQLQQAHLNLTHLGEDSEKLHQAYLAKKAEQVQTNNQLVDTQSQLELSQIKIAQMESSKFWQLRNFWFDLKHKFGFKSKPI
jgi:glycosyltransferase involved in cell wall biosynthesis